MVLLDGSIWIDYFRTGNRTVDQLIEEDLVCTNEIILTEISPAITFYGQSKLLEYLFAFPQLAVNIDWDAIRLMQLENLKNGINNVGIGDLLILQNVMEHNLELYTLDKHFRLMHNYFDFKLFK